jgi:hypothetical protein
VKYRFNASQVVEISRASSFAHAAKARKKLAKMIVSLNVSNIGHLFFQTEYEVNANTIRNGLYIPPRTLDCAVGSDAVLWR